ncbi:DUF6444 domain-containing protein [Pseudofrankia sp. BMG5.37]|uniref:DUF6444 domain-containing protein n=1 Tax=Pseudofrankia sp. BMG5.37 TaxID=3050035 RepID=UPI0037CC9BC7
MVEALWAQVAELMARLGQNSRNSSEPPPSDSPSTKPPKRDVVPCRGDLREAAKFNTKA